MTKTIFDGRQPSKVLNTVASQPASAGQRGRLPTGSRPPRLSLCALLTAAISVAAGCGPQGPQRYDLSGDVTYDGKDVPKGYITFEPDNAKGNSGPGAAVDIVDGHYATRPGQGTVGGPHVVTISGFDGVPFDDHGVMNPMGRPLFEDVELEIDLPMEPATRDIELP